MVVLGGVGVSYERGTPVWSDINLRVVTFPHSGLPVDCWAEVARKSFTLSVGTPYVFFFFINLKPLKK